jgi:excisionase family DNA binding protein
MADEVMRVLRRHGLAGEEARRVFRALTAMSEEEWEVVVNLLDSVATRGVERWVVPAVKRVVELELDRWQELSSQPQPLLDVKGVARWLAVSERTVERLLADGALVPIRVGDTRRFTREAVEAFLRSSVFRRRRRRKR